MDPINYASFWDAQMAQQWEADRGSGRELTSVALLALGGLGMLDRRRGW